MYLSGKTWFEKYAGMKERFVVIVSLFYNMYANKVIEHLQVVSIWSAYTIGIIGMGDRYI